MKFGDKVRVKSGFYEGIEGSVIDSGVFDNNQIHYLVKGGKIINDCEYQNICTWINENNLEEIK